MKLKSIFQQQDDQEDQWISIADMMAGLMIVFLFIAIVNLKDQLDKLKSFEILQDRIYNDLNEEFKDDLKKLEPIKLSVLEALQFLSHLF